MFSAVRIPRSEPKRAIPKNPQIGGVRDQTVEQRCHEVVLGGHDLDHLRGHKSGPVDDVLAVQIVAVVHRQGAHAGASFAPSWYLFAKSRSAGAYSRSRLLCSSMDAIRASSARRISASAFIPRPSR
jgi:hypothetical protein